MWIKNLVLRNSRQIAPDAGSKFKYEYDFGDSWEHTVKVEALLEPEEDMIYRDARMG